MEHASSHPRREPSRPRAERSALRRYLDWLAAERGLAFDGYDAAWRWSTEDLDGFWGSQWDFWEVRAHAAPDAVLADRRMPGARWFPGATLNYAEHALAGAGAGDGDLALIAADERGEPRELTYGALRAQVGAVAAGLRRLGVGEGDRVAALLPNGAEAVVALLATASLGAVWTSCPPEFGAQAVRDRFAQVAPVVLLAVEGYRYGGRAIDLAATIADVRGALPGLRATVVVPGPDSAAGACAVPDALRWDELLAEPVPVAPLPVPFDHPLWVLYSSGTTGPPKGLVHGHGGILLEHLKALGLHLDVQREDRLLWFTTTGWMMWNFLVSGLLHGATCVLYDGSPGFPDTGALWRLAERTGTTIFGTSPAYLQACEREGMRPAQAFDLGRVHTVGVTGAPLPAETAAWTAQQLGPDVLVASISGGTDVCTAFVGSNPLLPAVPGEIQCRMLGAAVEAFGPAGTPVRDGLGELVVTAPMPSMPLRLWGDDDGARLRESYFEPWPGVWRHGDWVRITERGSVIVSGRSDATLNRRGIRMGTSEFYGVAEAQPGVLDSLVVDTSRLDDEGELLLFAVLAEGVDPSAATDVLRAAIRTQLSPRHVPDAVIPVAEIPRTLNGKKCEVPVKAVLTGTPIERAIAPGALRNPDAVEALARAAAAARAAVS